MSTIIRGIGSQPWSTHDINPSWEIVKLLPSSITVSSSPAAGHTPGSAPSTDSQENVKIGLLVPCEPLKVSYHASSTLVPQLLQEVQPDLVLHLGLASRRAYYGLERSASRTGLRHPDVDGEVWTGQEGEEIWPQNAFPDRLETGLNYDTICRTWLDAARELGDVRSSDDVGVYLCGFTYYTSLSHYWATSRTTGSGSDVQDKIGPVLFLHVPPCDTQEKMQKGRDITIRLIESMVVSWLQEQLQP